MALLSVSLTASEPLAHNVIPAGSQLKLLTRLGNGPVLVVRSGILKRAMPPLAKATKTLELKSTNIAVAIEPEANTASESLFRFGEAIWYLTTPNSGSRTYKWPDASSATALTLVNAW